MKRIMLRLWLFGYILTLLHGSNLYAESNNDATPQNQDSMYSIVSYSVLFDPINPLIRYVTTNSYGVVKSVDGGATWLYRDNALDHEAIFSLAIDPANPEILYAGTYNGVYKSTDGNRTWNGTSLNDQMIKQILLDPHNPSIVYAAAEGGIFKSVDAGSSWHTVNNGFADLSFYTMAINPITSSILYASMRDGLYKSIDSGASWQKLPMEVPQYTVFTIIAIDPTNPARIYGGYGNGIYTTSDSGATWQKVTAHPIESLVINPHNSNMLYAAILVDEQYLKYQMHQSTDHGATWTPMNLTEAYNMMITVNPFDPASIYVETGSQGLLQTHDTGETWKHVNLMLPPTNTSALGADPTNPNIIFAAGSGSEGIFKSSNAGATWESMPINALGSSEITSITFDPSNSQTIYASSLGMGVLKSNDGGQSWFITENKYGTVWSFAIDPRTPTTLYAGGVGLFRSLDAGEHWSFMETTLPNDHPVAALLTNPQHNGFILVGFHTYGIYRSWDHGATWDDPWTIDGTILHLSLSAADGKAIYVGTEAGLYTSIDDGDSWASLGLADQKVQSVVVDPHNPKTIYAGTEEGLYKSVDGGQHWSKIDFGGSFGMASGVTALYINPELPSTLYIATEAQGLYIYRTSSIYTPWIAK